MTDEITPYEKVREELHEAKHQLDEMQTLLRAANDQVGDLNSMNINLRAALIKRDQIIEALRAAVTNPPSGGGAELHAVPDTRVAEGEPEESEEA